VHEAQMYHLTSKSAADEVKALLAFAREVARQAGLVLSESDQVSGVRGEALALKSALEMLRDALVSNRQAMGSDKVCFFSHQRLTI
jgi:hypothetical protein